MHPGKQAPPAGSGTAAGRPLTEFKTGAPGCVVALAGGHGVQGRLIGLGIRPGVRLEIRRNDGKGPVVVAVGGARVAIGRGMAVQILLA
ncbi:MAG: hypothetical protein A2498_06540 [Lentisphaerae bacterium RIFOXYC12_FULL_60_16]|nr:MAG: hypothetical protein A2498_06540 [Lentisphaerae bacterium RIFOXYC12_FULL_60_16]OGV77504.1 MAG: hypothetical protein A2340_15110 [Lentisphaerae bacterium RIFOXYB12_FULL_60_10]